MKQRTWKYRLGLCLAVLLMNGSQAWAVTEVLEVHYLPLTEAEQAVGSQLSEQGKVAAMPSRRVLVVSDDQTHVDQAKALLKQLDTLPAQYQATVEIDQHQDMQHKGIQTSADLPGGWVTMKASRGHHISSATRKYNVHVQSASQGTIETGEIHPVQGVVNWLAGYGFVQGTDMQEVTGGFDIRVSPAGEGQVHVSIRPWLQQLAEENPLAGNSEVVVDLAATGNSQARRAPQVNAWGNATTMPTPQNKRVDVVSANTEVTIPLGETVTLAAQSGEARQLGSAILSGQSSVGVQTLTIKLKVSQLP